MQRLDQVRGLVTDGSLDELAMALFGAYRAVRDGADLDALAQAITPSTRMVLLATPNNPTGTYTSDAEIERLHAGLPADCVLVLDQAYGEYLEDEIEKVPEISKVEIRGIQDKEMEISVDLYKMEISQISFNDISQAIQNENIFERLMEAAKVCSLGQITSALFEVGGQYRRNM